MTVLKSIYGSINLKLVEHANFKKETKGNNLEKGISIFKAYFEQLQIGDFYYLVRLYHSLVQKAMNSGNKGRVRMKLPRLATAILTHRSG